MPSVVAMLLDQAEQGEILELSPDHLVLRRLRCPFIELVWTSIGAVSSFID